MSLCINPNCQNADNPDNPLRCQSCGSELLLEGCYRITRPIGKGGFARTFEVSHSGKLKILKVLILNQAKAVSLFQQEAEVLKRLNHPGIPNAEEYFKFFPQNSQEPVHCLVMDKIDGENLYEWLEKRGNRPISEKQAVFWLTQLTNILHKVHQQQFFHRDIKPSNIMLTADGQLVLIDFGIAREITGTYEKKQAAGQITKFVSDGYAPLEQINGHAVPQSDFFALGRTFVHFLTGKYPLDLMDDPYDDPYTADLNWRVEANQISPLLADFIDHLMMRPVKERPANTQVILERLLEINETLYPTKLTKPESVKPLPTVNGQTFFLERTLGSWYSGHSDIVRTLAIIPDGQTLVSGGDDETIKIWNLYSAEEIKTITPHSTKVFALAISPDGQTLVSDSDDSDDPEIILFSMTTGQQIRTITGHSEYVNSLAISPDGQKLVSGSHDKTVKVWNLHNGKEISTLATYSDRVTCVAISPDGRTVASGSADTTIQIWPKRILSGHSACVNCIAISPDSQILVSGSDDKTINVWNLNTGEKICTLVGHTGLVLSVAFSSNGKNLVSGGDDGKIKLWDLSTKEDICTRNGHSGSVNALVFSLDGQIFISGGEDNMIKIWRIY
ncbi:MAG: serine/threonine-protein kinase [Nostoc sp.]|uniref:serine/threonine-protein kinase n=1 Tax=Nostoc sp. TaxID=1180 RepID=UPI002FF8AE5D